MYEEIRLFCSNSFLANKTKDANKTNHLWSKMGTNRWIQQSDSNR